MAIDLTALDVRSKRGDFTLRFRGYDRDEVDSFITIVADRIEELSRECKSLRQHGDAMERQLKDGIEREQSIKDAVVSAQKFGKDMIDAAQRKSDLMQREAEERAHRIEEQARRQAREIHRAAKQEAEAARTAIEDLCHQRARLLRAMGRFLNEGANLIAEEEQRDLGREITEGRIAAILDREDPEPGGDEGPELPEPSEPSVPSGEPASLSGRDAVQGRVGTNEVEP